MCSTGIIQTSTMCSTGIIQASTMCSTGIIHTCKFCSRADFFGEIHLQAQHIYGVLNVVTFFSKTYINYVSLWKRIT